MRKQDFISHQNRFVFSRQITNRKNSRNSINQNARISKKVEMHRFSIISKISITSLIFVVVANKHLNSKINFMSIFVIARKMLNVKFLRETSLSFEENFKKKFRNCINILYY